MHILNCCENESWYSRQKLISLNYKKKYKEVIDVAMPAIATDHKRADWDTMYFMEPQTD